MLHAMNTLSMACMVEPILWFLALITYSRFSPSTPSRFFLLYLATQLAVSSLSVPVLFFWFTSPGPQSAEMLSIYTQIFWWGAIIAGMFAIAALREILKRLLASLAALQRIALITLQWILVVAAFIIFSRILAVSGKADLTGELATLANGMNVLQLVMLLPLLPFTFVVRRSLRSHFQDLMMGLAVLAISNIVLGIFFYPDGALYFGAAVVAGHIILVATQVFWIGCFVMQGRGELPDTLSLDSKLVRWNEKLRILDRASTGQEQ